MAVLELLFLLSATGAVVAGKMDLDFPYTVYMVWFSNTGILIEKKFAVGSPATLNCPQGVRYNDGCNWCDCQPEDGAISCTRRACVSILPGTVRFENGILRGPEPFSTMLKNIWKNLSSWCLNCIIASSTIKIHFIISCSFSDQRFDEEALTNKCPQGVNYKDDCNSCRCNPETGIFSCTRVACAQPITIPQSENISTDLRIFFTFRFLIFKDQSRHHHLRWFT